MSEAIASVRRMLNGCRDDRKWYSDSRLRIEAAACAIREKALMDALEGKRIANAIRDASIHSRSTP